MTKVSCSAEQIRIDFPGWEALMAPRSTVTIPLRAIRRVRVEPGWSYECLGLRNGLGISGYRMLGTFRHRSGTRRLVSMKRGLPLLRLVVDRSVTGFDEVLLSTPDAADLAEAMAPSLSR